ncbi:hypothetical protein [Altererythrobacter sp. ZODW24]|uniref:hypothetical protein n=1 Tax=Altererythrobacter sp. ZODW24 TaxID=2185142 RepID=UPI000DF75FCD|nr:hypothetical protein [Altererythrobacter sp. ZODW24]
MKRKGMGMSFAAALLLMSSPASVSAEPETPRPFVTAQASATILAAERVDFEKPGQRTQYRASPRKSRDGTTYTEFH